MRLIYTEGPKKGKEVKVGDKVKSFRGEQMEVTGWQEPHKPSSSGRINVTTKDGFGGSYYPDVVGAEWVEREDRQDG